MCWESTPFHLPFWCCCGRAQYSLPSGITYKAFQKNISLREKVFIMCGYINTAHYKLTGWKERDSIFKQKRAVWNFLPLQWYNHPTIKLYRCNRISLTENSGCFPRGKPAVTVASQPTMHAGCLSVSIIHPTLTRTKGSFMRAQMHLIAHGGVRSS